MQDDKQFLLGLAHLFWYIYVVHINDSVQISYYLVVTLLCNWDVINLESCIQVNYTHIHMEKVKIVINSITEIIQHIDHMPSNQGC